MIGTQIRSPGLSRISFYAAIIIVAAFVLAIPPGNIIRVARGGWQAVLVDKKPDVIYKPTPPEVVERMLDLAEIKKNDVLYDLGCGDGRIVVAAAKRFGIKALGFDIDPRRVEEARANVRENNLEHLVTIKRQDIFTADISEADVVTMYLLPNLNVKLMPKLAKLKPGTRIVSHAFNMKGAKPKTIEKLTKGEFAHKIIYLWEVPWEKE